MLSHPGPKTTSTRCPPTKSTTKSSLRLSSLSIIGWSLLCSWLTGITSTAILLAFLLSRSLFGSLSVVGCIRCTFASVTGYTVVCLCLAVVSLSLYATNVRPAHTSTTTFSE